MGIVISRDQSRSANAAPVNKAMPVSTARRRVIRFFMVFAPIRNTIFVAVHDQCESQFESRVSSKACFDTAIYHTSVILSISVESVISGCFLSSHSQIVSTLHPDACNSQRLRSSRLTVS